MQRPASCSPDTATHNGDNSQEKRASLAYLSAEHDDNHCHSPDPMMETSRAMRKLSEAFGAFFAIKFGGNLGGEKCD
jgi:hypothetical protein